MKIYEACLCQLLNPKKPTTINVLYLLSINKKKTKILKKKIDQPPAKQRIPIQV